MMLCMRSHVLRSLFKMNILEENSSSPFRTNVSETYWNIKNLDIGDTSLPENG